MMYGFIIIVLLTAAATTSLPIVDIDRHLVAGWLSNTHLSITICLRTNAAADWALRWHLSYWSILATTDTDRTICMR